MKYVWNAAWRWIHMLITLCCNSHTYNVCSNTSCKISQRAKKEFILIYQREKVKKAQLTHKKVNFPALGGVSSATPVSVWPWLSFFHMWCPGKCATCYLGHTTRALHPSTRHQSLLAHAQSHGGPTLTTVLDYDDTFVSEERAALGHRHHFEPISRLRLLLCAGGWPTVTNFFSSALVFRKELRSALYFNSDLRFNDHQGTFQIISASLVFLWIRTDKSLQQRTMLTLVPKAHPMLKTQVII